MSVSGVLSSAYGWVRSLWQAQGTTSTSTLGGTSEADARRALFAVNELLYSGNIYDLAPTGRLDDILRTYVGSNYCDATKYRIHPWFMPFGEIVDVYQNVLPGCWGQEIQAQGQKGKQLPPRLTDALTAVWNASGFDTEKGTLIRWAANFGTVGMRIRGQAAEGDKPARAVVSVDHPGRLFSFEEDDRGNVTAVCLKYRKVLNVGTLTDPIARDVAVVEVITKDEFSLTYDGREQLPSNQRENTLGFCPYVILRHRDNGTQYGDWAYKGSEALVHRINWRISRQDKSIDRHQFPKWFGAGAGGKPESAPMGDESMTYVTLSPDSPTPLLQAIVPQIDQANTLAYWLAIRDLFRQRQPEINLNDMKLIAGISGETLAQMKSSVENRIKEVRPGYLHAVKRALQMAVSVGVSVGAYDLGTNGDADRAFRDGREDFDFAPMPALPETPQQRIANAQADVAKRKEKFALANAAKSVVNDPKELLILAGYTEEEATRLAAVPPPAPPTAQGGAPGGSNGNGGANSPRIAALLARLQ